MADVILTEDQPTLTPQWTETLSDPVLRGHASLSRYKTVEDFAKGHLELEKKFGERPQGVQVPAADAPADQWQALWKQLPGYPEAPDKYGVEMPAPPEGAPALPPEQYAEFLKVAHDHGVTTRQLQPLVEWYARNQAQSWEGMQRASEQSRQTGLDALKKQWGPLADRNMAVATEGLKRAFGERIDFLETVVGKDSTGAPVLLGNVPEFVTMAYELAMAKGHDRFVVGANGMRTPQAAQERIQQARQAMRAGTMTDKEFNAVQEQYGPLAYSGSSADFQFGPLTASDVA